MKKFLTVALAGNPNVGKSTIFNNLTGMHQHTGNWPGKTVEKAEGDCETENYHYHLIDLPGTYSLTAHSPEEQIARDFLCNQTPDMVIVVCDGTCLERNLNLALQIIEICPRVIVCVNLMDEAEHKGIVIDLKKLSKMLGVPVIGTKAHQKNSIKNLKSILEKEAERKKRSIQKGKMQEMVSLSEIIYKEVVEVPENHDKRDRRLDRWFTGRWTGFPCMILLFMGILWITMAGSNYPSEYLTYAMFWLQERLRQGLIWMEAPWWLQGILVDGVYQVVSWVISVMLPPMAVFFPLFTLLEDSGYLPRAAYNLDCPLKCCGTCGKQALTMTMGFGCNAVGIMGSRIIDSPRERLIAILTNVFIPCNGRFPTLIAVIAMFCSGCFGEGWIETVLLAGILTVVVLAGVFLTLIVSKILSNTILKGVPSFFALELPPYRKPQIGKVIMRSILDRTIFVLGRAAAVAAPAGAVIWMMANIKIGNASILSFGVQMLEPLGKIMGLDGTILMAFILGFPANEIVLPIMIMIYTAKGNMTELLGLLEIRQLFLSNGWDITTAVCFLIFSIAHWPCAASFFTIRKETGSFRWMAAAFFIPAVTGILLCTSVHLILQILS